MVMTLRLTEWGGVSRRWAAVARRLGAAVGLCVIALPVVQHEADLLDTTFNCLKPIREGHNVSPCRQVHCAEVFGESLCEQALRGHGHAGRLVHGLAELHGLHGIDAERIARILPLAQQVTPNISEIRIPWRSRRLSLLADRCPADHLSNHPGLEKPRITAMQSQFLILSFA
jgi:hypothetical protein